MLNKWNRKQIVYIPSHDLKKNVSEQRLEKKMNDVNSFNISINNINEMIQYFKDKNNKSERKIKK